MHTTSPLRLVGRVFFVVSLLALMFVSGQQFSLASGAAYLNDPMPGGMCGCGSCNCLLIPVAGGDTMVALNTLFMIFSRSQVAAGVGAAISAGAAVSAAGQGGGGGGSGSQQSSNGSSGSSAAQNQGNSQTVSGSQNQGNGSSGSSAAQNQGNSQTVSGSQNQGGGSSASQSSGQYSSSGSTAADSSNYGGDGYDPGTASQSSNAVQGNKGAAIPGTSGAQQNSRVTGSSVGKQSTGVSSNAVQGNKGTAIPGTSGAQQNSRVTGSSVGQSNSTLSTFGTSKTSQTVPVGAVGPTITGQMKGVYPYNSASSKTDSGVKALKASDVLYSPGTAKFVAPFIDKNATKADFTPSSKPGVNTFVPFSSIPNTQTNTFKSTQPAVNGKAPVGYTGGIDNNKSQDRLAPDPNIFRVGTPPGSTNSNIIYSAEPAYTLQGAMNTASKSTTDAGAVYEYQNSDGTKGFVDSDGFPLK